MSGKKSGTLSIESLDNSIVSFEVQAENIKNPYLLWVANYCNTPTGPTAQFKPVLWDNVGNDVAVGHVSFELPVDADLCRAYIWQYPDPSTPIFKTTLNYQVPR